MRVRRAVLHPTDRHSAQPAAQASESHRLLEAVARKLPLFDQGFERRIVDLDDLLLNPKIAQRATAFR
jgi:hypothetical protein